MGQRCTASATITLLLFLATCLSLAAQVRDQPRTAPPNQLGAIAGRVEFESERQRAPVRRAHVKLTADSGGKEVTTTTDTDGRYRVERLGAGTYRIRIEKPGFVPMAADPGHPNDSRAPIQVKAGETVTADVQMQRGAVLEGQFVDDLGNGIKSLRVYADRVAGTAKPSGGADTYAAATDDLGRFRLHTLPPGIYYLRAASPPPAYAGELYFPDAPSSRQATALALVAGQTIDHLDFRIATGFVSNATADAPPATASAGTAPWARVSGRITRSGTGEPIANATARLIPVQGGASPSARSDANGQFEITAVAAGSYVWSVAAEGFVTPDSSVMNPDGVRRTIDVKDRERVDTADLTLAPAAAIEVRVLDEFGDPAPGVSLQLTQVIPLGASSVFMPIPRRGDASTELTDDRGLFRMTGLSAGDYYLFALSPPLGALAGGLAGLPVPDAGDEVTAGFAATFFPGTASLDAATPVHIAAGADMRDVTFGLVGTRMVTISGIVINPAGQPAAKTTVVLIQTHGGEVRTMVGARTVATENGSFHFSGVPEGTYVLQGFGAMPDPASTPLFGSLPLTAAATFTPTPLEVMLTLRTLTTVRGHLSFEGDIAPPRDPASVRIQLQPTDFTSGPVGGAGVQSRISPSWDFEIKNLAWKGVIRTFAPPEWRLKRVSLDGRDITDTPYDFQSGDVNGLDVVLTSRLGVVTGTVMDAGKPASNATVFLFSLDEATWTTPSRFTAGARPDAKGAFSIRGLLPGQYLAVALPPTGQLRFDREALAALKPFATSIEVSEGTSTPVTLPMIRR